MSAGGDLQHFPNFAASSGVIRSSASTNSTHSCRACGMAQFLKFAELMYSRSMMRQPPISRTMSSVPSVEPESAIKDFVGDAGGPIRCRDEC